MVVEKGEIIVDERVKKVCALFDIDPYSSISEGTLIVTCRPGKANEVSRRLNDKGIRTTTVGEVVDASKGTTYFEDGRAHPLEHPKVDPFWAAFGKAAEGR
jgi:hydrogenase expression/formation protein HypE